MKKVRRLLALLMGLAIFMSCACSKTDSSEKKKKESVSQTSVVDDESETTKTTVEASQTTDSAVNFNPNLQQWSQHLRQKRKCVCLTGQ